MADVESRYGDIDLIIVRENAEDPCAGIEHGRRDAESIKIITREASEIAQFAFSTRSPAAGTGHHVHKANIMKL
jgi:isocitrate/isopropylmalate dehydrogenase